MFTSIKIKNYKSCNQVELDHIGSIVVLVGRNGAGKSNILGAIQWGASSAVSSSPLNPRIYDGPTSVEFVIRIGIRTFLYKMQIKLSVKQKRRKKESAESVEDIHIYLEESVQISERNRWKEIVKRENTKIEMAGTNAKLQIGPLTPCLPALGALLPPTDALVEATLPLISFLRQVRYYHFDEPSKSEEPREIITNSIYKKWLSKYESTSDPGDSALMRILHMKLSDPEKFTEFESLIGSNGIGLLKRIHYAHYDFNRPMTDGKSAATDDEGRLHYIAFTPDKASDNRTNHFGFDGLSLGTRRIIRILASLVFDQSSAMLIEHPEDGIHPGLTKKLMGLLRDYANPLQLFISSHSLTVFNTLSLEDVRFVTMVNGETKARGLTDKEVEAARKYISEEGDLADVIQSIEER